MKYNTVDKKRRAIMKTKYCNECNETHEIIAFCQKCGACLYLNNSQNLKIIKKTKLPIFTCKKCNYNNFLD